MSRTRTRRAELFDGLVALLLAEGFSALTLDELAARLRCSKRTLYALAGSKEQLVRAAVVHFFRGATERVEAAVADVSGAAAKVAAYLHAVATELAPASPEFLADVGGWLRQGRIKYREDITDGLENAPRELIGLLRGENFGKKIIRVGPPPTVQ